MTPEQYRRLTALFQSVMERPVADREQFARQLCAGDPELLGPLLDLIRSAGTDSSALQTEPRYFDADGYLPSFLPNEVLLDRFRIVRFLGRGGMGEVYEADDSETGRVALKTIRPEIATDLSVLERFRREVLCARKVNGTNVCRIHEIFSLPSSNSRPATAFLTMEILSGITLSDRLRQGGPLPVEEAERIAVQICRGLQAIHEADIVHRDLKSRNIMLAERKRGTEAVLMDFGLARETQASFAAAAGSRSAMEATIAGTPEYMAPEQFQGLGLTAAADIYALGVVLYEMATGRLPFQGSMPLSMAIERAKPLKRASSLRKDLPHRWDAAIERCLRYQPEERFASALDVADALTGTRVPRMPATWRFTHKLFALVLFLLMATAISGFLYRRHLEHLRTEPIRIAVLPFDDLNHNPADQAFCDGLVEVFVSQLTELERFQGTLLVVPSTEVRHQHVGTAREAYKLFGVSLVLTGSVQRSTRFIRVFVNVIDAKSIKEVRSKAIEIPESDPELMQTGVVSQVADLLDIQLKPEARSSLAAGQTTVPGAYEYYVQGYGYLRQFAGLKTVDAAIEDFQQALEIDHSYVRAYAGLGEAYWRKYLATKNRPLIDLAWKNCRTAIALNGNIAAAHNTLGLLYFGTGKYGEAQAEYDRALAIDPGNRDAFSGLAAIYERTGNLQGAEATFKRAIQVKPDYWNGYVRLATFYTRHGRYQDAVAPLEKVISLVPDNPTGHYDLGGVYLMLGRNSLAEQELRKSIDIRPTASAYSDLAMIYLFQSRFSQAAATLEQALRLDPGDPEIWGNLGDAYRLAGSDAKARQAYQRASGLASEAVRVNHQDAGSIASLASYQAKLGNRPQASTLASRASQLANGNANTLYDVAVTYEVIGRRAEAIKALQRAVDSGFSRAQVFEDPDLSTLRRDPAFNQLFR